MKIPIRLFPNTKLVMTPRLPPPLRVSALRSRLQTSTKAAITIALAALLAACSKTNVEANGAKPTEGPVVAVAQIKTANLSRTLTLTAEFKPYQEVDVMAKVAGYIKEINVDIGDRVSQDQLLAILEIPEMDDDLRRANASVERSQANVKQAQDELARAKSAYDVAQQYYQRLADVSKQRPGLVAQQEIDDAKGKALVAQAQVAAANSAVQSAQQQVHVNQADVAKVHTLMDYTRVSAPFTGVVTKRYADKGSMIQAGTASQTQAMPVVRLSQNNLLRLILPVPESAVPTMHIGQQVEVRVTSLQSHVPRQRQPLRRQALTRNPHHEHRSRCPKSYAYTDARNVRGGRSHACQARSCAGRSRQCGRTGGDNAEGQVAVVTPNHRVEFRKIRVGN